MILNYKQCIEKYGSDYQIEQQIQANELVKVEKGIYSTNQYYSELDVLVCKYPNAVFTMDSAFYYHGLTDVIPETYFLATDRSTTRIHREGVKQLFVKKELFEIGITTIQYQNSQIKVYDLERMLIELIRTKNQLPFDYYKEIISSYRRKAETMDFSKLCDYTIVLANGDQIINTIQMEVL